MPRRGSKCIFTATGAVNIINPFGSVGWKGKNAIFSLLYIVYRLNKRAEHNPGAPPEASVAQLLSPARSLFGAPEARVGRAGGGRKGAKRAKLPKLPIPLGEAKVLREKILKTECSGPPPIVPPISFGLGTTGLFLLNFSTWLPGHALKSLIPQQLRLARLLQ